MNLSIDVDPKDWNWQALVHTVNTRWGLPFTAEQLKQLDRPILAETLTAEREKVVAAVDLTGGRPFLELDWGRRSLCDWVRLKFQINVDSEQLADKEPAQIKEALMAAIKELYDRRYRPEMRRLERSLLLNQLDVSWKNHLYTMDHLRQGIGLVGYAQIDPKTEYKRQGMKDFEAMWGGFESKVTDSVFRMEDEEGFEESLWAMRPAVGESVDPALVALVQEPAR
jgi:preprotein translocase subunit SecA